jgi:hypothetical protein
MRASSLRAAAVAAVLLSIAGCGAPDFGDEPRSYSSNWPHADPTPSESSSASTSAVPSESSRPSASAKSPDDGLPAILGGQPRATGVDGGGESAPGAAGVTLVSAHYEGREASAAVTLGVYRGKQAGIRRIAGETRAIAGTKVGRSSCGRPRVATVPVTICWRSDDKSLMVSLTGSGKRSFADLVRVLDEAWRAVQS